MREPCIQCGDWRTPHEQVLPEEAVNHRIVVPEATQVAFLQQLCESSGFLLTSLEQIAAGPLGAEIMVQVRLECVCVCCLARPR